LLDAQDASEMFVTRPGEEFPVYLKNVLRRKVVTVAC
jgi:hypothetical protein